MVEPVVLVPFSQRLAGAVVGLVVLVILAAVVINAVAAPSVSSTTCQSSSSYRSEPVIPGHDKPTWLLCQEALSRECASVTSMSGWPLDYTAASVRAWFECRSKWVPKDKLDRDLADLPPYYPRLQVP